MPRPRGPFSKLDHAWGLVRWGEADQSWGAMTQGTLFLRELDGRPLHGAFDILGDFEGPTTLSACGDVRDGLARAPEGPLG